MNELVWIGPALIFGFLATRFKLPAMVGYLIGGFIMNAFDIGNPAELAKLGELGVTLLLFTIGLKLDIRSLLKPYVWAGASLHMLVIVVVFGVVIFWISATGLIVSAKMDFTIALMIAFALSFSSTVFAVKTLEENGEMASRHGQIAIGFLIIQDIIAVAFLALSTGTLPSVWSLALFLLIPLRPLFMHFMTRSGHGELLILYGLALPFGVWAIFDMVGVKGDLGALIIGALLAAHPSAIEMSKKLMGFKDVLLVGFFLSIGAIGEITVTTLLIALVLAVAVIFKTGLYFLIMIRFGLRARTSVLASFNLANYSEFGLIVGAIALKNGWLSSDWLVIIALSLTITFVAASSLNAHARGIFSVVKGFVCRFEKPAPLPEDVPIDTGDAKIAIIGMARLGSGLYETLNKEYDDIIVGISSNPAIIERHQAAGRNVILADATDDDFCSTLRSGNVKVVVLAMLEYEENYGLALRIQESDDFTGNVYAVAEYPEQIKAFEEAGVNAVWDLDTEAGIGIAQEVIAQLGDSPI